MAQEGARPLLISNSGAPSCLLVHSARPGNKRPAYRRSTAHVSTCAREQARARAHASKREPQVEKSNGITPIAAKKRRISQPIARKTVPGDPPWPQEPPRLADARPTSAPMHAWATTPPRARRRLHSRRLVMFLLDYLREFSEFVGMLPALLLPGPNLRYATMRMYTHNTTEGRRRPA